jgi:uncharacterized protein involved in exopolysaccharide biosynthesis
MPDQQLTVRDLLQAFSRRRSTSYWSAAGFFLAEVLLCTFATQQYQASATIQIREAASDGLDPNTLLGVSQSSMDAPSAYINIQTQKLENTKEFLYRAVLLKSVSQFISLAGHLGAAR